MQTVQVMHVTLTAAVTSAVIGTIFSHSLNVDINGPNSQDTFIRQSVDYYCWLQELLLPGNLLGITSLIYLHSADYYQIWLITCNTNCVLKVPGLSKFIAAHHLRLAPPLGLTSHISLANLGFV